MKTLIEVLSEKIHKTLDNLGYLKKLSKMPLVVVSQQINKADYQSNIAMSLARKLGGNPRQVAEEIVTNLVFDDIVETKEVAGPGFINLRIKTSFLINFVNLMAKDKNFCIKKVSKPKKILIDFSGPNLAKEMHVGHLRSTIIGDSIARFYEFFGNEVLRVSHLGDWGTQFGMLIEYIRQYKSEVLSEPEKFTISSLEAFYRKAKFCYDTDQDFVKAAQLAVVKLQSGDKKTLAIWKIFCKESLKHCDEIYKQFDIKIKNYGESFYNAFLDPLVKEMVDCNLAKPTQGAIGIFLDGYENSDGEKVPIIIQKSDGGFIYATTDLAALQYRFKKLKIDEAVYITDVRQRNHFKQIFTIAEKMKWLEKKQCKHIGFGMMLNESGQPFKTRDGGTIKLKDLIDEAKIRAYKLAKKLSPNLTKQELQNVSIVAGIGSIKYADLVHGISTDYKFQWDKMLASDGNTAFYLLINYARTRSIGRFLGVDCVDYLAKSNFKITSLEEKQFILKIASLPDLWKQVLDNLAPNILLNYLYELSRLYSAFWNACPIAKEQDKLLQESRLALCGLFGSILTWGLDLVGIKTLEKI